MGERERERGQLYSEWIMYLYNLSCFFFSLPLSPLLQRSAGNPVRILTVYITTIVILYRLGYMCPLS